MIDRITKPRGGVYVIRVEGVGNYYGESDNIIRRWSRHHKQLNNKRHNNHRLKAAWNSPDIGPKKFKFEILERSEELTLNKDLRRYKEKLYIAMDPTALNIVHGHNQDVTAAALPDREQYRNRTVFIVRTGRSSIVKILNAEKQFLGTESVKGKFRLGQFTTDNCCNLTRVTTRKKKNVEPDVN